MLLTYLAAALDPERDTIYNVKAVGKNPTDTISNINAALRWMAKQDIRLVSMSLGVPMAQDDSICRTAEEVTQGDSRLVVVAAAGNDPAVPMCPAAARSGVLPVGQVGKKPPIDVTAFVPAPRLVPWTPR
jgi:hypothetical protein